MGDAHNIRNIELIFLIEASITEEAFTLLVPTLLQVHSLELRVTGMAWRDVGQIAINSLS